MRLTHNNHLISNWVVSDENSALSIPRQSGIHRLIVPAIMPPQNSVVAYIAIKITANKRDWIHDFYRWRKLYKNTQTVWKSVPWILFEGPNFLVIHPDECIDCALCEPECPAEAIYAEDEIPEG